MKKQVINYHITYETEKLKLSELQTCLKLISESINEFRKKEKIGNDYELEPLVEKVDNGSFFISIIIPFLRDIVIEFPKELLISLLVDAAKKLFSKKINFTNFMKIDTLFKIENKKDDVIEIHINNKDFKW